MNYDKFIRWIGICIKPTQFELGYRQGIEDSSRTFRESGEITLKHAIRNLCDSSIGAAVENPTLSIKRVCHIRKSIAFEINVRTDKENPTQLERKSR